MDAVRIILSPSKNRLCALPCTFNKSTQIENVGDEVLMFFSKPMVIAGGMHVLRLVFRQKQL